MNKSFSIILIPHPNPIHLFERAHSRAVKTFFFHHQKNDVYQAIAYCLGYSSILILLIALYVKKIPMDSEKSTRSLKAKKKDFENTVFKKNSKLQLWNCSMNRNIFQWMWSFLPKTFIIKKVKKKSCKFWPKINKFIGGKFIESNLWTTSNFLQKTFCRISP